MLKWLRNLRKHSKIVKIIICTILLATFYKCTYYGEYHYSHVPEENIPEVLYKVVNPDLKLKPNIDECTYESLLKSRRVTWEVPKNYDSFSADSIVNGSYMPQHCNPLFSVAILVTYRNRQRQLDVFLPYMHDYLRKQNIHYRIYLIEQKDEKPWNKGILYNVGAKRAMSDKFPCLILHDVDLLPLAESNLYACLIQPRHLSASIDKFRYVLPYKELGGGVLAIRSDQYKLINGFSNKFIYWGGEDDDFSKRILANNFEILRFPTHMAKYTMMVHKPESKNHQRRQLMADNLKGNRSLQDGLNSVRTASVRVTNNRLFTLLEVKLL